MEEEWITEFKDIERTSKQKEEKSQIEHALGQEIERQNLKDDEMELMKKFKQIPRLEFYNPVVLVAAAKFVGEGWEPNNLAGFLDDNRLGEIPLIDMIRYIRFYEKLE